MAQCPFCDKPVPVGVDRCPSCGAWLHQTDNPLSTHVPDSPAAAGSAHDEVWEADVRALVAQGQKIQAIKVYREHTGVGLAEAKSAVEHLERGEVASGDHGNTTSTFEPQLLALLAEGQKIQAIKLYRDKTGAGLKEAKDAVEALASRQGIVVNRSGCLGMLVFFLIAACVMAWLSGAC